MIADISRALHKNGSLRLFNCETNVVRNRCNVKVLLFWIAKLFRHAYAATLIFCVSNCKNKMTEVTKTMPFWKIIGHNDDWKQIYYFSSVFVNVDRTSATFSTNITWKLQAPM